MTDKARELLERALEAFSSSLYGEFELKDEIRAYLAEPEVPFVRLTHDEVNTLMNRSLASYELICAVENRLVEKNK